MINSCTIQIFGIPLQTKSEMVRIAQLVRASDCGSEGRGFESLSSPQEHCEGSLAVLFLWHIPYRHLLSDVSSDNYGVNRFFTLTRFSANSQYQIALVGANPQNQRLLHIRR